MNYFECAAHHRIDFASNDIQRSECKQKLCHFVTHCIQMHWSYPGSYHKNERLHLDCMVYWIAHAQMLAPMRYERIVFTLCGTRILPWYRYALSFFGLLVFCAKNCTDGKKQKRNNNKKIDTHRGEFIYSTAF